MTDNVEGTILPQYRCNKIVGALQIKAIHSHPDGAAIIEPVNLEYTSFVVPADYVAKHNPQAGGYFVQNEDGYKSYSPAQAFENGYHPLPPLGSACGGTDGSDKKVSSHDPHFSPKGLNFSSALDWLKVGERVQRAGWNGKGQYVIRIPGEHLARSAGYGFGEVLGEFTFGDVLALKNAQNIMQPGWVPSMGDLFAEDWQVYVEYEKS